MLAELMAVPAFVVAIQFAPAVSAGGSAPGLIGRVAPERVPDGGIQPQVQIGSDGTVHLLYFTGDDEAGDVHYVQRRIGDTNFSEPVRVNSQPGSVIAAGTIRGAQLALGGTDVVHVAWNGSRQAEPKGPQGEFPLLYSRLIPDSQEFEPQRNLIVSAYGLDGGACVAADGNRNVYVSWHAGTGQEDARRVWLARSSNNGETFEHEQAIDSDQVGACGCCGMTGTVSPTGQIMFLYRSAREDVQRDMYLLTASDPNTAFASLKLQDWTVNACPMSSATFVHRGRRSWAAWETADQVYCAEVTDAKQPTRPQHPQGKPDRRKHPRLAVNHHGELLLTWTEGAGWKRGGRLAWQLFDASGVPIGDVETAPGVPVWSFAAPYSRPDGTFVILY